MYTFSPSTGDSMWVPSPHSCTCLPNLAFPLVSVCLLSRLLLPKAAKGRITSPLSRRRRRWPVTPDLLENMSLLARLSFQGSAKILGRVGTHSTNRDWSISAVKVLFSLMQEHCTELGPLKLLCGGTASTEAKRHTHLIC